MAAAGGVCDEGGQHNFRQAHQTSTCNRVVCCPCFVLCSCLLSTGQAATAPVGGGLGGTNDDERGIVCTKCGLSESEASALNGARQLEMNGFRTSKGPGYFSQTQMTTTPTSNQPQHPPLNPNLQSLAEPHDARPRTSSELAQGRAPPHEVPTPRTRSRVGTPVGSRPKSSGGAREANVKKWLQKVEPSAEP